MRRIVFAGLLFGAGCAGESPSAPSDSSALIPASPPVVDHRVWVFNTQFDEIVMENPYVEPPRLDGGHVQVTLVFEEHGFVVIAAQAVVPNAQSDAFGNKVESYGDGEIIDLDGQVIVELTGCREDCPVAGNVLILAGSAVISADRAEDLFLDGDSFGNPTVSFQLPFFVIVGQAPVAGVVSATFQQPGTPRVPC